jgi:hypothetical protein
MGLSFTIAAGPRQRSHSQVRVPRDSWPYFTVSDSRRPQPGGPSPRIYIAQEQGGLVIPPSTRFFFSLLPTTRRTTVEVFDPASARDSFSHNRSFSLLYSIDTDRIGNTSPNSSIAASRSYCRARVEKVASQLLYWCLLRICCLATDVFTEPFPSNGCLYWLHSSCLEKICHNSLCSFYLEIRYKLNYSNVLS